jgi:hypothetical protein
MELTFDLVVLAQILVGKNSQCLMNEGLIKDIPKHKGMNITNEIG